MPIGFHRYDLRTRDVPAAEHFYAAVLGESFWRPAVAVSPLPERAAALGAPPHWLGHIAVADVEATQQRLIGLGAQPLGPVRHAPGGSISAALRDPFGAVIGLASGEEQAGEVVAWHCLHCADHHRAFAWYAGLFGWAPKQHVDLGEAGGSHQLFAWLPGGEVAGSVADTARQPAIHTHWMYFFPAPDLDRAIAAVRANGGTALEPLQGPGGARLAACEDAQGAAFGLMQRG